MGAYRGGLLDGPIEPWLAQLAHAEFEALVGMYVQVAFPDLFSRLDPTGSNGAGRAVRAPFDFVHDLSDGTLGVVEATTTEAQSDIAKHMRRKIDAVATSPVAIGAFVYVAQARRVSESLRKIWRTQLVELGVPVDRIHFIFREELLRELAEPRCAQIRVRFGLAATMFPIEHLRDVALPLEFECAGPDEEVERVLATWAPEDDDVERALQRMRGATVIGGRGSGKTLLAARIALRRPTAPAYYLDLGSIGPMQASLKSTVLDRFVALQAPNALFVLDNANADLRFACDIVRAWIRMTVRSSLIVLTTQEHPYGGDDVEQMMCKLLPVVPLRTSEATILSAYHSVSGAMRDQLLIDPPATALAVWARDFADIGAFIHAVMGSFSRADAGDWTLSERDAVEHIESRYLRGSAASRRDLSVLAVLDSIGVLVREELLTTHAELLTSGLVVRRSVRTRRRLPLYGFRDPSISRLLVKALRLDTTTRMSILEDVARRSPPTACLMGLRLLRAGRGEEARLVVRAAVAGGRSSWERVVGDALPLVVVLARLVLKTRLTTPRALDEVLVDIDVQVLDESLWLATPKEVTDVVVALRAHHLTRVANLICDRIRDGLAERLAGDLSRQGSLGDSIQRLLHVRENLPTLYDVAMPRVVRAVVLALSESGSPDAIREFRPGDCAALARLVDTLRDSAPEVLDGLTGRLRSATECAALAHALSAAPDAVADMLAALASADVTAHARLAEALGRSDQRKRLARRLANGADHLPRTLQRIANVQELSTSAARFVHALDQELAGDEISTDLSRSLVNLEIPDFLRTLAWGGDAIEVALERIDVDQWAADPKRFRIQGHDLRSLELALGPRGRLDLMTEPANVMLRGADVRLYPAGTGLLTAAATTLRHGLGATDVEVRRFLRKICSPGKLQPSYEGSTPQSIGGALHSIWAVRGEEIIQPFVTKALRKRLRSDLSRPWRAAQVWPRLSLLGAAELAGALPPGFVPSGEKFRDAFAIAKHAEPMRTGAHEFQRARLWRGLYVLAMTNPDVKHEIYAFTEELEGFTYRATGDREELRERHRELAASPREYLLRFRSGHAGEGQANRP